MSNPSKTTASKKQSAETTTFQKKEKEQTYGLTKPLNVKWEKHQAVGDYVAIEIANSETRTPIEFVISKWIGKTVNLPKETLVINRRKDVPDLIRDAADPMKKRLEEIAKGLDLIELESKEIVAKMGENYVFTMKVGPVLSGQIWNRYLDRTKESFEKAKEAARKEHEESEGGKPFRQQKKFIYDKSITDFMNKDEKAVQAQIQSVLKDPKHVKNVEKATESSYETLIDGERPQIQFKLKKEGWEHLSKVGLTDEIGKTILQLFKGEYEAEKQTDRERKLTEENIRLKKELEKHVHEVQMIHAYYQNTNVVINQLVEEKRTLHESVLALQEEAVDLRTQIEDLQKPLQEEEETTKL